MLFEKLRSLRQKFAVLRAGRAKRPFRLCIARFSENMIDALVCDGGAGKKRLCAAGSEPVPSGSPDAGIAASLQSLLSRLGCAGCDLIVALSRHNLTVRCVRVPSDDPSEIEQILTLQSLKYLPVPVDELATGHEMIATDGEGFTEVSFIIAHKSILARYDRIVMAAGVEQGRWMYAPSSAGLAYFSSFGEEASAGLFIIGVDGGSMELALVRNGRYVWSRLVGVSPRDPVIREKVRLEFHKNFEDCRRHVPGKMPARILAVAQDPAETTFFSSLGNAL